MHDFSATPRRREAADQRVSPPLSRRSLRSSNHVSDFLFDSRLALLGACFLAYVAYFLYYDRPQNVFNKGLTTREELRAAASFTEQSITHTDRMVNELKASMNEKLLALQMDMEKRARAYEDLVAHTGKVESRIADLEATMEERVQEEMTKRVAELEGKTSALFANYTNSDEQYKETLSSRVASLDTRINQVDTRIGDVQKAVEQRSLAESISSADLVKQITDFQKDVETQRERFAEVAESVKEQGRLLVDYVNSGGAPGIDWAQSALGGKIMSAPEGVNRDWRNWGRQMVAKVTAPFKDQTRGENEGGYNYYTSPSPTILLSHLKPAPTECFLAFSPYRIEVSLLFPDVTVMYVGLTQLRHDPFREYGANNFTVQRQTTRGEWEEWETRMDFKFDPNGTELQTFKMPPKVTTAVRFTFLDNTGATWKGKSPLCLFRLHVYGERMNPLDTQ